MRRLLLSNPQRAQSSPEAVQEPTKSRALGQDLSQRISILTSWTKLFRQDSLSCEQVSRQMCMLSTPDIEMSGNQAKCHVCIL